MLTFNVLEAKTNLSRLIEAVENGSEAEIIIARNGRPAARLVPIAAKVDTSKRLGLWNGRYPVMTQADLDADNETIAAMFSGEK